MIAGAHGAAATLLNVPIRAVASRTSDRAEALARQLRTKAVGYDELPSGADIVVVSTPPQCHAANALSMLKAGAAVILEKPICTTLVDADLLVEASAASGGRLLYAENLAYSPMVSKMLSMTPGLGPLNHLEVRTLQALPTWGSFTTDEWGGGALFDLGVHPLALAVLLARVSGAGPVTDVSAMLRGGSGHNSDEHAEVLLTFATGLVARVVSSWQSDVQIWDVQASSSNGVLRGDFWPRPTLEHNGDPVDLKLVDQAVPMVEDMGYAAQMAAFAEDLDTGVAPFMDAEFGRLILDIVCAAYSSARSDGASEPVPFRGDRTRTPLQLWRG